MTDEVGMRLAELEGTIGEEDGYTAESRAAEILEGLGIATARHTSAVSTLAGGYKLRVLIAQTLFGGADVLLLDEPTNHLDLDSIRWLEAYLTDTFRGTLLVVSHDRHFMNAIATHVADVDYQTVTRLHGRLRRLRRAEDDRQAPVGGRRRAEEEEDRRAQGLRGPLRREREPVEPGAVAREGDREAGEPASQVKRSSVVRPYIKFTIEQALGARRAPRGGPVEELRREDASSTGSTST